MNDESPSSNNRQEETYNKIIGFYDLAEDLIDTVEDKATVDPISQLEFIEPIVNQIEEATDELATQYRDFIRTGKTPGFLVRRKIAKSLKAIYTALDACRTESVKSSKKQD